MVQDSLAPHATDSIEHCIARPNYEYSVPPVLSKPLKPSHFIYMINALNSHSTNKFNRNTKNLLVAYSSQDYLYILKILYCGGKFRSFDMSGGWTELKELVTPCPSMSPRPFPTDGREVGATRRWSLLLLGRTQAHGHSARVCQEHRNKLVSFPAETKTEISTGMPTRVIFICVISVASVTLSWNILCLKARRSLCQSC